VAGAALHPWEKVAEEETRHGDRRGCGRVPCGRRREDKKKKKKKKKKGAGF